MSQYWTKPRSELIEAGVDLARLGYHPVDIASTYIGAHFTGRDPRKAHARLRKDIALRFYRIYAGMTKQQQAMYRMARDLKSEGWRPIFDLDCIQCYWYHAASHLSVNNMGGFFANYETATTRAYESALRSMLHQEIPDAVPEPSLP